MRNIVRMDLSFALPYEPQGSEGDPECNFSLLTHTKKLLLLTFCDLTAETGVSFRIDGRRTEGQTDVEVEIVI